VIIRPVAAQPLSPNILNEWLTALEARHMANLRLPEVTRALRALSSAYVERRHALARGAALDSAGKRAAFALFYAPLHFLIVHHIVTELDACTPKTIVDLGCGSGAAGASWAVACGKVPQVIGIDRHPWAVDEARWTYKRLGLDGRSRQSDAARFRFPSGDIGVVAAYVLNELLPEDRDALVESLIAAARERARVVIVEPIARTAAPWWDEVRARIEKAGGRADEWRIELDLPPLVAKLDDAAGLDHREVKARSLFIARSK
jgi:SAM-dependent methyltransferase